MRTLPILVWATLLLMPKMPAYTDSLSERSCALRLSKVVGAFYKTRGLPNLVDNTTINLREVELTAVMTISRRKSFDDLAMSRFLKRVKVRVKLGPAFAFDSRLYFPSENVQTKAGWRAFHRDHPGELGFILLAGVNPVAFKEDKIVVFTYSRSDVGCGASYLLQIERQPTGGWIVTKKGLVAQFEQVEQ